MYKSFLFAVRLWIVMTVVSCASSNDPQNKGTLASKIEEKYQKFKGYFKVHTYREHVAEHKAQEAALAKREEEEEAKKKNARYAQNVNEESKK